MTTGATIQCPKCSADNLPESRFCSSCGQEFSSVSQMPTMEAPESPQAPVQSPHVGRIVSSDSVPAGGFTPGTILADRYRVIGLLGRGGMGEVYRADDLKLGQPVALKFLPPALAQDSVRRERFFAEVRITRQLSHPNICRVYDIGEVDGRHFLSMEYIDGEDLASLMKRIGHLSNEKALDIARQLVAGLSVAHERGVLHRDLKPANIMLDGHGRVRITDFGLAIAVGDEYQAEEIAGTPAYMAPEQLAGKGATIRSDIYSLGLILYEIYTGKKAFHAKTLAELREQKETQTPRAPSELREGIDPVVERVIQRCMEKDPSARPASVAQLAQALPGGDPLAAAIAAGETPSPEMVAALGSKEGLKPLVAWGLLAFIIVGTLMILWINDNIMLHRLIPFDKRPEALVEISQQFLKKTGYSGQVEDSAYGFIENSDLLRYIVSKNRRKILDEKAILFWYRQSPRQLSVKYLLPDFKMGPNNPPLEYPGEALVMLDTEGRLMSFRSIPIPVQSNKEIIQPLDWDIFFSEAGLDINNWDETNDLWYPPSHADTILAWQGTLSNYTDALTRIKAAAFSGHPFYFEIIAPWNQTSSVEQTQQPIQSKKFFTAGVALTFFFAAAGGIFFARRNLRLGRGDRRNATRLVIFILILSITAWLFIMPRVSFFIFLLPPYLACLSWLFYMAVEPFVRRNWPQILVSWTRLISGEWKDPLVGRDILVGFTFGVFSLLIVSTARYFQPSELLVRGSIWPPIFEGFLGSRFVVSDILLILLVALLGGLSTLCFLVLMRVLLRNQKVAIVVCVMVVVIVVGFISGFAYSLFWGVLWYFLLIRFGLTAAIIFHFVSLIWKLLIALLYPAWYSGYGYFALVIFAAIVLYAFRTSLGSRPLFGTPRLDD